MRSIRLMKYGLPSRVIVERLGTLLAVGGIGYIAYLLWSMDWSKIPNDELVILGIACLVGGLGYAVVNCLLLVAWTVIMACNPTSHNTNRLSILIIYAWTQLFKYLPTNIFHFVGRHAAIRGLGIEDKRIAEWAILEIVGVTSAGLALAFVMNSHKIYNYAESSMLDSTAAFVIVLLLSAAAVVILSVMKASTRRVVIQSVRRNFWTVICCVPIYGSFFVGTAAAVWVACGFADSTAVSYNAVLQAVCVSWVVGFVVPGAPAGFGVRDASVVTILLPLVGAETATLVAMMFRGSTLIGDGVFGGSALIARRLGQDRAS